jgi:methylated-DNA-protein-cysteine methyltransferase related protein
MSKTKSDFFDQVFQVVRLIPYGRVTTYGAIAAYLGAKSSSRVVGYAMNASHSQDEFVPAHRVLNRNGQLTGKHHFSNPFLMQELLEKENLMIENDKVLNFNSVFWDPSKELIL